ncbi:MAG: hypothetical protein QNJ47_03900 [Nostocaceae cyanobacterium]|nr:hypothetical protein [Nostocaceae cyanobacterium]
METTTKRQDLIQLIYTYLKAAPESTLLKVLELLEDEEDIRDARAELEDIKRNGGIPWSEIKKDMKKDIA